MASFLLESQVREAARRRAREVGLEPADVLRRDGRSRRTRYDIFLSQTIRDAELVLGVYVLLTEGGYSVFCDWIDAPEDEPRNVTPANAELVRTVMKACDSLLFLDTPGAVQSLWMCWELGWFDGENGHVAVLPVVRDQRSYYSGREFLGLYPVAEIEPDGTLRIVRPAATNSWGVTLFESANWRDFPRWIERSPSDMRPRIIEGLRPW